MKPEERRKQNYVALFRLGTNPYTGTPQAAANALFSDTAVWTEFQKKIASGEKAETIFIRGDEWNSGMTFGDGTKKAMVLRKKIIACWPEGRREKADLYTLVLDGKIYKMSRLQACNNVAADVRDMPPAPKPKPKPAPAPVVKERITQPANCATAYGIPEGRQAYDGNFWDWDSFPEELKRRLAALIMRNGQVGALRDPISENFSKVVVELGAQRQIRRWGNPTELIYLNGEFRSGSIREDAVIGGNPQVKGYHRQLLSEEQWKREVVIKAKAPGGFIVSPIQESDNGYHWLRVLPDPNRPCGLRFHILVSKQPIKLSDVLKRGGDQPPTAPARQPSRPSPEGGPARNQIASW